MEWELEINYSTMRPFCECFFRLLHWKLMLPLGPFGIAHTCIRGRREIATLRQTSLLFACCEVFLLCFAVLLFTMCAAKKPENRFSIFQIFHFYTTKNNFGSVLRKASWIMNSVRDHFRRAAHCSVGNTTMSREQSCLFFLFGENKIPNSFHMVIIVFSTNICRCMTVRCVELTPEHRHKAFSCGRREEWRKELKERAVKI